MSETVFVIGAGASKEAGLPTGEELKGKIANFLDIRFDHWTQVSGDHLITETLREIVKREDGSRGDINPLLEEAWHIRDGLPLAISIDNFIDSQKANENIKLLGKLAIARSILEAESRSKLFYERSRVDSTISFHNLGDTWFLPFFQLLTENCEIANLGERLRSIALIVFNYDRCIEHFLLHALQRYYRATPDQAAEIVNSMNIYHPYGLVGNLPWQGGGNITEFGSELRPASLFNVSQQIKTFSEGTDPDSSEIIQIKDHIENADKLVFLGFAFHKLNMSLLEPQEILPTTVKTYASTFGISESDRHAIHSQICALYQADVKTNMATVSCSQFFKEFWRSLAL